MAEPTPTSEQVEMPSKNRQEVYSAHTLPPGSKCTRVLDILPVRAATNDEPIRSVLSVINLESNTSFTALSYVWGTYAVQRHTILCDDVRFDVTSNCYSALWHLRKKLGGFRIWLDAICINQEDVEEKSQQIPLMGDIYTKAALVYVWLGEGSSSSDRAMAYLSNAGFHKYFRVMPDGTKEYRPYAAAWSLYTSRLSLTRHPSPFWRSYKPWVRDKPWIWRRRYVHWEDLRDVLDREWALRVWTYQEILLASRPVLVCGNSHLPWADFEWSILFMIKSYYGSIRKIVEPWGSIVFDRERLSSSPYPTSDNTRPTLQEYEMFVGRILTARSFVRMVILCLILGTGLLLIVVGLFALPSRRFNHIANGAIFGVGGLCICASGLHSELDAKFDFFKPITSVADDLVGGIYRRQATNPKDMAYGMWAILEKRGVADLPEPTYTWETGQIYWMLTVHLIRVTGSLNFLPLAAARGQTGFPSWVPDWSASKKHKWVSKHGCFGTDISGWSYNWDPETVAMACSRESPSKVLSIDQTQAVLTVHARDLGSICGCASFRKTSGIYQDSEKDLHLANLRTMFMCATRTLDLGRSMAGTLLNYCAVDRDKWPKDLPKWNKLYAKSRRESLEQAFRLWIDGRDVPAWFHAFLPTQILMCNLLAQQDRKVCSAIITSYPDKIYLTACSLDTQVSDRILRILGLPRLFVVRKLAGSSKSVIIVSPMVMETSSEWSAHNRKRSDTDAQENQFVEYQIH